MKLEINIIADFNRLHCYIAPRYWEDSYFNGKEDDENGTIAHELFDICKFGDDEYVHLILDLNNGVFLNWPKGTYANFNYKSCDMNKFVLSKGYIEIGKDGYVIGPKFMNDYGDYFAPTVNRDGKIKDYNKDEMEAELKDWLKTFGDDE